MMEVMATIGAGAPRLSRRAALARAAGAAGGLFWLSACGGRPAAGGPVTLTLQTPADAALLAEMLPRFLRAEPGIRVNVSVAEPDNSGALATALVAGSGPDVFWDNDPSRYLGTPLVLDLAPLARRDGYDLSDFGPSVLEAFRFDGGLFMLPRSVSPGAYAVRLDVLDQVGVDLPAAGYTADDLAALWRRLSAGGRRIGGQLVWAPDATFYLNGWGAHLVDPADGTRCALDAPEAIACGQWMWDRFWRDGSAQGLQGQASAADFFSGTLAMMVVACADVPGFAGRAQAVPWRLLPFPRWPAGPSTFARTDFYAIAAQTKHAEAAWKLLAFISSAAWQSAAISSVLLCPSRISLWEAFIAAAARTVRPLALQPLEVYAQAVQQDWARPPERFRYQNRAAPLLTAYWQKIFGSNNALTVADGFPQAAADIDAAEDAAARAAAVPSAADAG
jgi:multiple sugar transport system substrate-binding protein